MTGRAVNRHVFDASDLVRVKAEVRDASRVRAEEAFDQAIADGKNEEQAKKQAHKAAERKAKEVALAKAEAFAHARAKEAIADGTVFDMHQVDENTARQRESFEQDQGDAGRIAAALAGADDAAFHAFMTREESSGRLISDPAQPSEQQIEQPRSQIMKKWEYLDGTVVRYKPLGDDERPHPTYSVELKINPDVLDFGQQSIAFKVNASGRPAPKGPGDVSNYFEKGSHPEQFNAFLKYLMNEGHLTLSR